MLNERLISNAWDLLQNGPAIVDSADKAGSLAGRPPGWRRGEKRDGRTEARGGGAGGGGSLVKEK